tara:strand:- start:2173 stop:2661 length:489 start_codon:yes stop_codon:yes gene_type:complete
MKKTLTIFLFFFSTTCFTQDLVDAQRYSVNSEGLVTDNNTGLVWMRCSLGQQYSGDGCEGDAEVYSWNEALSRASNADYFGHSDWRLPNVKELLTLTEADRRNPSIAEAVFPNTPAENFWTSTPSVFDENRSWGVSFDNGANSDHLRRWADYSHVRLVRGNK